MRLTRGALVHAGSRAQPGRHSPVPALWISDDQYESPGTGAADWPRLPAIARGVASVARYAASVILVWNFAHAEAVTHRAGLVEPEHVLLGLTRLCDASTWQRSRPAPDADPGKCIRDEIYVDAVALRACFEEVGIDPAQVRGR